MTVMLYKHPGKTKMHGDKFDYCIVDEADVSATKADGWALTTDEAKNGKKKPVKAKAAKKED